MKSEYITDLIQDIEDAIDDIRQVISSLEYGKVQGKRTKNKKLLLEAEDYIAGAFNKYQNQSSSGRYNNELEAVLHQYSNEISIFSNDVTALEIIAKCLEETIESLEKEREIIEERASNDEKEETTTEDSIDTDTTTDAKEPISFTFSLDENLLIQIERRKEDILSYAMRHRHHDDSKDDSESDPGHRNTQRLKVDDLLNLPRIVIAAREYEEDKDYPVGEKKGKKRVFCENGINLVVRLDKDEKHEMFHPRIAKETDKDKTTIDLSKILEGQTKEYKDNFFRALRNNVGEDEDMSAPGFSDGIMVRNTVLGSDVLDYLGNSVITELLLSNATQENYEMLFTGDKHEGSYGALPSQNTNSAIEDPRSRNKVYGDIGNFIKEGVITVSTAKSNLPTLRKFRSLIMTLADRSIIKIRDSNGEEVSYDNFIKYVHMQHKSQKTAAEKKSHYCRHSISSSEDEDFDRYRFRRMSEQERQEYLKNMKEIEKVIERKKKIFFQEVPVEKEEKKAEIENSSLDCMGALFPLKKKKPSSNRKDKECTDGVEADDEKEENDEKTAHRYYVPNQ